MVSPASNFKPVADVKRRRALLWVSAARAMMDQTRMPNEAFADVFLDATKLAGPGVTMHRTVFEDLREVLIGSLTTATPQQWLGAFPGNPESEATVRRLMSFQGGNYRGSIIKNANPAKYAWVQRMMIILYRRYQAGEITQANIHQVIYAIRGGELSDEYRTLNLEIAQMRRRGS